MHDLLLLWVECGVLERSSVPLVKVVNSIGTIRILGIIVIEEVFTP